MINVIQTSNDRLDSERCCFCWNFTLFWTNLESRENKSFPEMNVACCPQCAQKANEEDVPFKDRWSDWNRILFHSLLYSASVWNEIEVTFSYSYRVYSCAFCRQPTDQYTKNNSGEKIPICFCARFFRQSDLPSLKEYQRLPEILGLCHKTPEEYQVYPIEVNCIRIRNHHGSCSPCLDMQGQ